MSVRQFSMLAAQKHQLGEFASVKISVRQISPIEQSFATAKNAPLAD
jgi:hypothetical protein